MCSGYFWEKPNVGTYLSNVDTHIDSILSGILADRTTFDKYLAAYKAGHFYQQKQRNEGESKTNAESAYRAALADAGISYAGDPVGNIIDILESLQNSMLTEINNAMGVNATNIESAAQRDAVSGLNADLIQQIQDIEQLRAAVNDLSGVGYNTYLGATLGSSNPYNQSSTENTVPEVTLQNSAVKATHFLANGFDYGERGVPGTILGIA
jgi:hypothetical protein